MDEREKRIEEIVYDLEYHDTGRGDHDFVEDCRWLLSELRNSDLVIESYKSNEDRLEGMIQNLQDKVKEAHLAGFREALELAEKTWQAEGDGDLVIWTLKHALEPKEGKEKQ